MRKTVYGEKVDSTCRVRGSADETVAQCQNAKVSECQKLAQKEYKEVIHDNIAKVIHCEKWGFEKSDQWYKHKPKKVLESEECKILWDFPIQTDKTLEHNRPDIIVIEKKTKKCLLIDPACPCLLIDPACPCLLIDPACPCLLIDPACPFDTRIEKKEEEKCNNYCDLKYEIARMLRMKHVEVIPVVIVALGTVTKQFKKWIQKLDLKITVEMLQKPCLLGTARICRRVLDMK